MSFFLLGHQICRTPDGGWKSQKIQVSYAAGRCCGFRVVSKLDTVFLLNVYMSNGCRDHVIKFFGYSYFPGISPSPHHQHHPNSSPLHQQQASPQHAAAMGRPPPPPPPPASARPATSGVGVDGAPIASVDPDISLGSIPDNGKHNP